MNVWLVENGDGYHGRIKSTSEQTLRENILAIVDSIEDCKARTTVLSIINYLIQLYKTASDAGSPNAFGTAIGVGGLITGVVADIMGGMNSGLSQNAIIADVIVDVGVEQQLYAQQRFRGGVEPLQPHQNRVGRGRRAKQSRRRRRRGPGYGRFARHAELPSRVP